MKLKLSVALCLAVLSGCGDSTTGPDTVEATGNVALEGSPVAGANIVFHPVEGSEQSLSSQSVTDAEGRFELSTHVGGGKYTPGIVPGKYAIAITKLDTAGVASTLGPPKQLLPKKYADPKTSGLSAEIIAGNENSFEFRLESD